MLLVVMNDWFVAPRPASNDWLIVHGSVIATSYGSSVPTTGKEVPSSRAPPSSTNRYAPSQYWRKSSDRKRQPSFAVRSTASQSGGVLTGL